MTEILEQGGWVVGAIGVLSLAAWTLILTSFLRLRDRARGGTEWLHALLDRVGERPAVPAAVRQSLVGQLLERALSTPRPDTAYFQHYLRPLLHAEATGLRRHLELIGTMAGMLPLLGLLGTVIGLIHTFEALTLHGSTETDQLAEGISEALFTTQAGLVCALPAFVAWRFLGSRIRRFLERAELCLHQTELALRAPAAGDGEG